MVAVCKDRKMSLLTELEIFAAGFYKDVAPTALGKYPEGITSFSPALRDEVRLRRVRREK